LNSIAKTVSSYPFKNMEHAKLTLDCSASLFVAPDRLIVSLKGGEIYIITLLTDSESLRNIRQFNIEKGPSSVIPTCLTKCCDNYLFISSRLGNSVLLKYNVKTSKTTAELIQDGLSAGGGLKTSKISEHLEDEEEVETDSQQKANLEELDYEQVNCDVAKSPSNNLENKATGDCDELDLILEKTEEQQNKSVNIVSYTFEICDMLLNIAPCGHSIVGESAGDYTEFETDTVQYHVDLVSSRY
jgi:cleavage and polyadenylation specificity factor subunit 1